MREGIYRFIGYSIFATIGLYAAICVARAFKHHNPADFMIGFVFAVIAAFLFAYLFIPHLADKLAFGFYTPKNVKPMPPEFPVIQAKIRREQYDEAVADLKALLEKDPGNYHVIALLVEIFVNKTEDHANAVGLITAYLRKEDRHPEDIPIIMMLADVYLDMDEKDKAVDLLKCELGMKHVENDMKQIRKRLEGFAKSAM